MLPLQSPPLQLLLQTPQELSVVPSFLKIMSSLEERMFMFPFDMDFEQPSPEAITMRQQSPCHILESILWPSTHVEMELHERAMKHVSEMGEDMKRSSLKRRLMMKLRNDGYDASLCRSSWVATTEHPGGDYEYVDVVVEPEHGAGAGAAAASSSRLVVDIDFRSQFQLARPAPWYEHLWTRLPAVFVGPRAKLRKAVSLLCAAAQRSLRESGLHVPPWRRSGYMQAKWLPCGVPLPGGAAPEVAAAQWSVAMGKELGGGDRRSGAGGLTMELSDDSVAEVDGCQGHAGSMWP